MTDARVELPRAGATDPDQPVPAAPPGRAESDPKSRTLHMIGNAHIDAVWLWQWQEGFQEVKATFRSALDRMRERPDFVFTCSSAAYYEWVERNEPELFAEIRQRVGEGRWQIVGGWWVEPDCNLPGGESFVRQALLGQRYFERAFGRTTQVGYNPDAFGHHAMLPQLLRRAGLAAYTFMRPQAHEMDLPRLFWWESPDGSRVLAYRIPFEYSVWRSVEPHVRRVAAELGDRYTDLMCFYGVGNHGGGPTREALETLERLAGDPELPRITHGSPDAFFAKLRADGLGELPVVRGELQHHAVGCYAAVSGVKRWNRLAEWSLLGAETFAALADGITGQRYPADELARAWKDVLFCQYHDILAGTSIEPAYEDARDLYGEAMAIAGRARNDAVQSIAWQIDIPAAEGMKPIVVFNPHSWRSRTPVELEFGAISDSDVLVDEEDVPVPFQTVTSLATVQQGRRRLTFVADLPPVGYRTYRLLTEPRAPEVEAVEADDDRLENEHLRLEIDPATGSIARLLDKRAGAEVFRGPAARAEVIDDPSDTWGHDITGFGRGGEAFAPTRIRLVERGPVKSVLRVESETIDGASRLVQDYTLHAGLARVDVRLAVDWRGRFQVLKLRFPVNVADGRAVFEIPYGHLERAMDGRERPGQGWLDVSGSDPRTGRMRGLSLLNDGKYSFDVLDGEIGMTVLRSPIYAHHDPFVPVPDGIYGFIDQGPQRFNYALLPHADGWAEAGTVRAARELNAPPIALVEAFHQGPFPQVDSYLEISAPNVVLGALKLAEDGDAVIVRCQEVEGRAAEALIRLPRHDAEIRARFEASEIRSFRVSTDGSGDAHEVDLVERPLRA